ncbi:Tim44/TimA family putative adaptor protein [Emcibacter nanhaiensis]|uniref:Tim44 domain-containing protein n=1 Tax=Emcibacter nanhaiensis TaxID=1505037 RepID=A0A501PMT0_9PROT|nr:Tim44/TimA family putative adaptor protein [Emcibacter nanhaiensis]TPD61412.1 Tim44 domain-containing protein [Emcibacter nanhaiensis]
MDSGSDNIELIILAVIAAFIIFQLRKVLGSRTGYDGSDEEDNGTFERRQEKEDNVVPIRRDQAHAEDIESQNKAPSLGVKEDSPFYGVLSQIQNIDRSFTVDTFLDGAEYAYGMVLEAFWTGNKKDLRNMLNKDVFGQFEKVIDDMQADKHHFENKLMDVERIDLEDVSLTGSMAEITVKYTSHMVLCTKDEENRIMSGDVTGPVRVTDIWTFCRDVKSSDPNWTLVATRNG